MTVAALAAVRRAIGALTYDEIEQIACASGATIARDHDVPLLQRSIANDLERMDGCIAGPARGQTLLSAIGAAIDEALLALAEAQAELERVS